MAAVFNAMSLREQGFVDITQACQAANTLIQELETEDGSHSERLTLTANSMRKSKAPNSLVVTRWLPILSHTAHRIRRCMIEVLNCSTSDGFNFKTFPSQLEKLKKSREEGLGILFVSEVLEFAKSDPPRSVKKLGSLYTKIEALQTMPHSTLQSIKGQTFSLLNCLSDPVNTGGVSEGVSGLEEILEDQEASDLIHKTRSLIKDLEIDENLIQLKAQVEKWTPQHSREAQKAKQPILAILESLQSPSVNHLSFIVAFEAVARRILPPSQDDDDHKSDGGPKQKAIELFNRVFDGAS